jgi:hypothetical protein
MGGDQCAAAKIDILNELPAIMSENAEQTECKTFAKRSGLANYLGSADNVNWGGALSNVVRSGHDHMHPEVNCIVDTCKYWQRGDICVADAIVVTGRDANECQDTDCHTFVRR